MELSLDALLEATSDTSVDAGISIRSALEPLAGPGSPVKPAVYSGGNYQMDRRWWGDEDDPVDAIVIDNAPSEANRLEQALLRFRVELGLPVLEIDLSGVGRLPAHVPSTLTSFDLPHRHADAYLRDAVTEDGTPFGKSEIGQQLLESSATDPDALLQWMPQSLLFGFWQSHQGKKGPQTKFARAVDAEVVGYRPASTTTRRLGLKGDPLNLTVDDAISFDPDDPSGWKLKSSGKSTSKKSKDSLAEIGHGQVPVTDAQAPLDAVSFRAIEQVITISFARLRNIETGSPDRNAAARALLATLGLAATEVAFSGSFTLRSGCNLRTASRSMTWRGAAGDAAIDGTGISAALDLFKAAADHGRSVGLPVGADWDTTPIVLRPNDELSKVIQKTFGLDSQ